MGLYFEDFSIGQTFTTPARTITEADVVSFSGLSGDYNPLHTDETYASQTIFKQRIVHGMLLVSIMTGLTARLGIFDGTVISLLELEKWKFYKPVFFGDTIKVCMTIIIKEESVKSDRGYLWREVEMVNQRGDVVQKGTIKVLMKRKPI